MSKSKSFKKRMKEAKEKGYDLHSLRRKDESIRISLQEKRTKTKKEKIQAKENKHGRKGVSYKLRGSHSKNDSLYFFCLKKPKNKKDDKMKKY